MAQTAQEEAMLTAADEELFEDVNSMSQSVKLNRDSGLFAILPPKPEYTASSLEKEGLPKATGTKLRLPEVRKKWQKFDLAAKLMMQHGDMWHAKYLLQLNEEMGRAPRTA